MWCKIFLLVFFSLMCFNLFAQFNNTDEYAQDLFVYGSDTILRKSDVVLSNQMIMSIFLKQRCFEKNNNYKILLCYNLGLKKFLSKEDFLSKRFMSYLEPTYQYLDKKYLSKEDKKKYKKYPKLLKLLQVDEGVIYNLNVPIATTDVKWVYCYMSSEQYYLKLLSITQEYHINWWFSFQILGSGEKFLGIIGVDENDNLWGMHKTKGGILPFNEFIERYWEDWTNILKESPTSIIRNTIPGKIIFLTPR